MNYTFDELIYEEYSDYITDVPCENVQVLLAKTGIVAHF